MSGDVEERFGHLLERHGASLRRLALVYAIDPSDADDLAQDIWLGIWRALPQFRGECSERTFVFRIGHNRGLSHRARRRRDPAPLHQALHLADHRPGPDERADRALRWEQLLDAVRRLPPGAREVVVLALEGMSHREIAEVTGLTENAVGVRLHRARAAMRAQIGPEEAK